MTWTRGQVAAALVIIAMLMLLLVTIEPAAQVDLSDWRRT